jgi:hypothetical protein
MMTTRDEWRKFKEKYGVPDAVCSFSIGEKIAAWYKKDLDGRNAKDFKGRFVAAEAFLKDVKTYDAALKKAKADKFKGKTPAEKAKNLHDSINAFHQELTQWESYRNERHKQAEPMTDLKHQVKIARGKLAGIQKNDLDGLKTFYQQQIRNDVGLPLRLARPLTHEENILNAFATYEKQADAVDDIIDQADAKDAPRVWSACQLALAGLAFAVGE